MNILDRILESNTTLIGYDAQNDLTVDKIVNFLPSVTVFGRALSVNSNEILEHFSSLSHSRNYKLESLLNDKKCNYIIINIGNVYFDELETEYDGGNTALKKSMLIKRFISEIQSRLYTLSDPNTIQFKLILLSQLYVTMMPNIVPMVQYKGGNSLLYQSDLVIKLLGDRLSIEKDRNSSDYTESNIRREIRDISIESLFNEVSTSS